MGKRYHCDYCDKTMVASPAIVKTHNSGLAHQKIVQEHYQRFKASRIQSNGVNKNAGVNRKDFYPETILDEESKKKPCTRFASGQCQFGSICRFSHYSQDELNAMKEYVAAKHASNSDIVYPSFIDMVHNILNEKSNKIEESRDGNTTVCDDNGITHVFPWSYNPVFDTFGENLPPSLKRFKIEDFKEANITSWG